MGNVDEHRSCARFFDSADGAAKGHGRGDHFIAGPDSGSNQRSMQAVCAGTDRDRVLRPDRFAKLLFELPRDGAGGQPARSKNIRYRANVALVNIRTEIWDLHAQSSVYDRLNDREVVTVQKRKLIEHFRSTIAQPQA